MNKEHSKPRHQTETKFIGELQEFSGPALSPDDPRLEPRVRRGRPGDSKGASEEKKNRKRKGP